LKYWKLGWKRFSAWAAPHLGVPAEEVDDLIRKDFEEMPQHLYQDKYKDLFDKYLAHLNTEDIKPNSIRSYLGAVRAFFASEATQIKVKNVPQVEMAMNEHVFTLDELKAMYSVADWEGKARLSTALSLGWSVGDILNMDTRLVEQALGNVDADGYAVFDARRLKTGARARAILNPSTVEDLRKHLATRPEGTVGLWTITTEKGINKWLLALVKKAGIKTIGQVRFHLLRKYVYDLASSRCGENEAKLLVGKKIPLEDATYLHGIEGRLLEKYKANLYQFVSLNGQRLRRESRVEDLEKQIREMKTQIDYLKTEMDRLSKRLDEA
jgi:hypothetical protein